MLLLTQMFMSDGADCSMV